MISCAKVLCAFPEVNMHPRFLENVPGSSTDTTERIISRYWEAINCQVLLDHSYTSSSEKKNPVSGVVENDNSIHNQDIHNNSDIRDDGEDNFDPIVEDIDEDVNQPPGRLLDRQPFVITRNSNIKFSTLKRLYENWDQFLVDNKAVCPPILGKSKSDYH